MPGFKIHISASTALGVGYGFAAHTLYGVPLPTAALGTTLCSVAGMLPDLDSGPGRPMNESISAAAAAIPMMMVDRFRTWGWPHETMILVSAAMYLIIRFGIKHWTVHRGIFHSFPVCLIFTELAFLICSSGDLYMRYFKAAGISIGFLSHLILDEIWSVDFRHARLKSSFGTALKFWCPCWWSNTIAYLVTAGASVLTLSDPVWIDAGSRGAEWHRSATTILNQFVGVEKFAENLENKLNSEGEAAGARLTADQESDGPSAAPANFSLPSLPSLPSWGRPIQPPASVSSNASGAAPIALPHTSGARFVERKIYGDSPPPASGANDGWSR
jgi:hypothetical protein